MACLSSKSMLLRGNREKKREVEGRASSDFTAPIIATTLASAEAWRSHGIHTVLTSYRGVPHYNGFVQWVSMCGPHRWYCIWVTVLISLALTAALAQHRAPSWQEANKSHCSQGWHLSNKVVWVVIICPVCTRALSLTQQVHSNRDKQQREAMSA